MQHKLSKHLILAKVEMHKNTQCTSAWRAQNPAGKVLKAADMASKLRTWDVLVMADWFICGDNQNR